MKTGSGQQLLSVSRAARLAGVSRTAIQGRIRSGELTTFEGMVALDDLRDVFPRLSLADDQVLERVRRIQRDAPLKANAARSLSRTEMLDESNRLRARLADAEQAIERYRNLLADLDRRLLELDARVAREQRRELQPLRTWLRRRARALR